MAEAQGVLVLGDSAENELSSISRELLAAGRRLADDLGEELAIALLATPWTNLHSRPSATAPIRSMQSIIPPWPSIQVDLYLAAMESLAKDVSPRVILIGRTNEGRELAPRLAFRLGVGLAQDCLEVSVDSASGTLFANRPVTAATPSPWSVATTLRRSPPSGPRSTSQWNPTIPDKARSYPSRLNWTRRKRGARSWTWWLKSRRG